MKWKWGWKGGQSISMFKLSKTAQPLMNRKFGWHGELKMAKNSYNSSHKEVESTFPPFEFRACLVTCSDQMNGTEVKVCNL